MADPAKVSEARQRIAAAVEAFPTLYAMHSGGKDAVALLHLCAPWRDRIKALWLNVGYPYPETEAFIRGSAERLGFDLVEAKSDIRATWPERGIPAPVAASKLAPWQSDPPIKVQLWEACCQSRGEEFFAAEVERTEGRGVCCLSGARACDGVPGVIQSVAPGNLVRVAPMSDWTDAEVWAFLEAEGAELPRSYSAGLQSGLDCRICPAMDRDEREYLRRADPEAAGEVEALQRKIAGAMRGELDRWTGVE